MLRDIAGIQRISKLYLQLLYRCNFNCQHCFHGERLSWQDCFTREQAEHLLAAFKRDYDIKSVTLLGGEPFLHRDLPEITSRARSLGLNVEICTNGYKIQAGLRRVAATVDKLRVSLEGLQAINDEIRHPGSFRAALDTLALANDLGVQTAITMTVNARNVTEVVPLAEFLAPYGVTEMKLHSLRVLGNVLENSHLIVATADAYTALHRALAERREGLPMRIVLDEDLDPENALIREKTVRLDEEELNRVEIEPNGELYVSCKAVGAGCSAFSVRKGSGTVEYRPSKNDELQRGIPQVRYSQV